MGESRGPFPWLGLLIWCLILSGAWGVAVLAVYVTLSLIRD